MLRARITVWVLLLLPTSLYLLLEARKAQKTRELTPAAAAAAMTVPSGFSVEVVLHEPRIVHPIAMTFDEKGRIWLVESPTRSAPGRIKILESSRGDGTYDRITPFPMPLRMPSSVALGHGGVWVADAPDILFFPMKDGVVGKPEVVITGFGTEDTNGLPNSLSWGPDGWLYGLSSVWCNNRVVHRGKVHEFSCAVFRIHPRTRAFELFAEGTSNPWGLTWDTEGNAFLCACVTDHLWHITQTGVYQRIAGAYPASSWPLGSIETERHAGHSHCGLHFFDSAAYPPAYRGKLFMGNVTSSDVNLDGLKRRGATYEQVSEPDFLGGRNLWFTPVAVTTGPDGLLYVLDWHDSHHCDHDMLRRERTADHLLGRLYRVRHGGTYRPAGGFDLAAESDAQLVQRLHSPNIYFRSTAQRLLTERDTPANRRLLEQLVRDDSAPRKARLHALWALIGGGALDPNLHLYLLEHADPAYRAWGVRAAGEQGKRQKEKGKKKTRISPVFSFFLLPFSLEPVLRTKIAALAQDPAPDVRLQVAIAVRRIDGLDPLPLLLRVARASADDPLIPAIVWQNLLPLLDARGSEFLTMIERAGPKGVAELGPLVARTVAYLLPNPKQDPERLVRLLEALTAHGHEDAEASAAVLNSLATMLQTGEVTAARRTVLAGWALPYARKLLQSGTNHPARLEALLLAATLKDIAAVEQARRLVCSPVQDEEVRVRALAALIAGGDRKLLECVQRILADQGAKASILQGHVLAALGRSQDAEVASVVLASYPRLAPAVQAQALDLLVQRPRWSKRLLRAVRDGRIKAAALNTNQVRQLLARKDPEVAAQVRALWGTVRSERSPGRERVVARMKQYLRTHHGRPTAGKVVFRKLCARCHTIYGEGTPLGPDLTSAGRASYDQLVAKVFDPNQYLKAGFRVVTASTTNGRVLTGLVVEDNPQRLVLRVPGGATETIPRADVEEVVPSRVSLMPEGIEGLLSPTEVADLFAFLSLDHSPEDPRARPIPGTPPSSH